MGFYGIEPGARPSLDFSDTRLLKKFWRLSSIEFLIARSSLKVLGASDEMREILSQNGGANSSSLGLLTFKVADDERNVLSQPPNQSLTHPNTVKYTTLVDARRHWLCSDLGINQEVWGPNHGDGVDFKV